MEYINLNVCIPSIVTNIRRHWSYTLISLIATVGVCVCVYVYLCLYLFSDGHPRTKKKQKTHQKTWNESEKHNEQTKPNNLTVISLLVSYY